LRADFENAVNSYSATCAELGKKPRKQYSGKMPLRIPSDLHYELAVHAESRGESVNSLVVEAVKTLCKRRKR
jgi:predicted HicB family RNase H-like nuclease